MGKTSSDPTSTAAHARIDLHKLVWLRLSERLKQKPTDPKAILLSLPEQVTFLGSVFLSNRNLLERVCKAQVTLLRKPLYISIIIEQQSAISK